MSTFDYSEFAETAIELIREFGQQIILSRSVSENPPADPPAAGGVYDPITGITHYPATGESDPTVEQTYPFHGVTLGMTEEYTQAVGAQNVQLRDTLIYMEPNIVKPRMSDTVVFTSTEVWQIVNILTVSPAGVDVLYILQVRP